MRRSNLFIWTLSLAMFMGVALVSCSKDDDDDDDEKQKEEQKEENTFNLEGTWFLYEEVKEGKKTSYTENDPSDYTIYHVYEKVKDSEYLNKSYIVYRNVLDSESSYSKTVIRNDSLIVKLEDGDNGASIIKKSSDNLVIQLTDEDGVFVEYTYKKINNSTVFDKEKYMKKTEDRPIVSNLTVANGLVSGQITAENGLKVVKINRIDGSTYKNITSFKDAIDGIIDGKNGIYILSILFDEDGDYTIQVIDNEDKESEVKKFTVGDVSKINFKESEIEVEAGKTYEYSHAQTGDAEGEFTVTSASNGEVTFTIKGKTITLSDEAESYLSTSLVTMNKAKAEATPSSVLFILKPTTKIIAAGTEAKSDIVSAGASKVYFAEKK